MSTTTVIACVGKVLSSKETEPTDHLVCASCCYDSGGFDDSTYCEENHQAIFEGAEIQCDLPVCEDCITPIPGYKVLHDFRHDVCIYCNMTDPEAVEWRWNGYGPPSYPTINVKFNHSPKTDKVRLAFEQLLEELHPDMRQSQIDEHTNDTYNVAWEIVAETWWEDAHEIAHDILGAKIFQIGRSGGWLMVERSNRRGPFLDRDILSDLNSHCVDFTDIQEQLRDWTKFTDAIKAHLDGVDESMADELQQLVEENYYPQPDGDAGGVEWTTRSSIE